MPLQLVLLSALLAQTPYQWDLPTGFPKPHVPDDNPMTIEKVELGRHLFYDARMSVNGRQSCASCHKQELAFTDGRAVGVGTTGEKHSRSAMSLVNVAYAETLAWANPEMKDLESQALVPMFGEHPVELGLRKGDRFLPTLRADPYYRVATPAAFPSSADPFTIENVAKAVASFERTIISAGSPWDRYHYNREDDAVSEAAKRGEILFFSQPMHCFRCHGGFLFGGTGFENTGLYNVPGAFSYPAPNTGIFEFTHNPGDVGKFKVPTLRNIAVTAPYMHDGSAPTLDAVLDHYAAGGRTIDSGSKAGVGRRNPNKSQLIGGFPLSDQNRADLIEFLKSLTDEKLLHDPRFADPSGQRQP